MLPQKFVIGKLRKEPTGTIETTERCSVKVTEDVGYNIDRQFSNEHSCCSSSSSSSSGYKSGIKKDVGDLGAQ